MNALRVARIGTIALFFSTAAIGADLVGPVTFPVTSGKPQTTTTSFHTNTDDTCGDRARSILIVDNPARQVSSAIVALNGTTLLGPSEFPGEVHRELVVELSEENTLAVTVNGGHPSGLLRVSVQRRIEESLAGPKTLKRGGDEASHEVFTADPESVYSLALRAVGGRPPSQVRVTVNGVSLAGVSGRAFLRLPVQAGPNELDVSINGPQGAAVEWQLFRELPESVCEAVSIEIDDPSPNAVVTTRRIRVSGTATGPRDIGITVNGVAALFDVSAVGQAGTRFPWHATLDASSGTIQIVATATVRGGSGTSSSREVMYLPDEETVLLSALPDNGAVPLTTSFDLASTIRGAISKYELDLDGDGSFEMVSATLPEILSMTYSTPGLREPVARITTADGRQFSSRTTVAPQSFAVMDAILRAAWLRFVGALSQGDIEGALGQLGDENARAKYRPPLTLIGEGLPQFASTLGELHAIWVRGRAAHYLLVRDEDGEPFGYHVYFARGNDGVWRLIQF